TAQGNDAPEPSIPSPTPPTPPPQPTQYFPSTSQLQHTPPQSPRPQPQPQPQAQQQAANFPMSLLQEALDAYAALTKRVEHLEYDKVAQALEITKLKRRVKKLEKGNMGMRIDELDKDDDVALMDDKEEDKKEEEAKVVTIASEIVTSTSIIISAVEPQVLTAIITDALVRVDAASTRKRKGVVIKDPEEESTISLIIHADTKSKDKGKGIMVKQKAKEDPAVQRYQTKEQMEKEESRAIQSINKTPAQKAAKRGKLNEEVEDLKRNLEIVPDEDDEVYTEATPLARKEAIDACAALTRRVDHLEYDKVTQALEITKLKRMVKKLKKGNRVKVLKLRRLKKVGTSQRIDTLEDTMMEDASNQGRMIDDLDKDDAVALMDNKEEEKKKEEKKEKEVKDDQVDEPAKVQEVVNVVTTAKLITKVVTTASETVIAVSTTIYAAEPQVPAVATTTAALVRVTAAFTRRRKGVVIKDPEEESTTIIPADTMSKDKGKGIMVEEPKPLKKKKQAEMDEEYARKLHEELNKDIDWDVAIEHVKQRLRRIQLCKDIRLDYFKGMSYDDIPKKRKLNEEVEDLKRHSEIVPDKDDDVYIEATPLARKVHVVDYEIIHLNNKPYYKIIQADGTHQLCTTLGAMFKRPDGQAQVWKNQRTVHGQAKITPVVFVVNEGLLLDIFKFPSIPRIKRKPHSPALTERLLIVACLLGYAMLQARFREGVYLVRNPLISSRLATLDQPEVTMDQITLLESRWSGPFTISQVFRYGTVELSQPNGPNFKVNGHRLKHYFGEDIPQTVVPGLQTFASDH
nr:reverse transcriptase domain-containing protein [Tanacetum cinerariifolium]